MTQDLLIVPDDHFVYKNMDIVTNISQPLFEASNVRFFTYAKCYDDGTMATLVDNNKEWLSYFYGKYLLDSENISCRLLEGINYWKKNTNQDFSLVKEDARENFNIDARIEFVFRDENQACYYLYSFYSDRKNADKAYIFYETHRAKLLKFIKYFHQQAASLIMEAEKLENRVKIPNYTVSLSTIKREYFKELKAENPNFKITDREFEIMIIYSAGFTAKQIAEMLHRSLYTIENHIAKIHKKTNCKDKSSLRKYVIDHGWDGLEKFFFSYLPDKPH